MDNVRDYLCIAITDNRSLIMLNLLLIMSRVPLILWRSHKIITAAKLGSVEDIDTNTLAENLNMLNHIGLVMRQKLIQITYR
jgi:hypothetical protein